MNEYSLNFKAKFDDNSAELVAKIAGILAEAKSEILLVENERMYRVISELEKKQAWHNGDEKPPEWKQVLLKLSKPGFYVVGYWSCERWNSDKGSNTEPIEWQFIDGGEE